MEGPTFILFWTGLKLVIEINNIHQHANQAPRKDAKKGASEQKVSSTPRLDLLMVKN